MKETSPVNVEEALDKILEDTLRHEGYAEEKRINGLRIQIADVLGEMQENITQGGQLNPEALAAYRDRVMALVEHDVRSQYENRVMQMRSERRMEFMYQQMQRRKVQGDKVKEGLLKEILALRSEVLRQQQQYNSLLELAKSQRRADILKSLAQAGTLAKESGKDVDPDDGAFDNFIPADNTVLTFGAVESLLDNIKEDQSVENTRSRRPSSQSSKMQAMRARQEGELRVQQRIVKMQQMHQKEVDGLQETIAALTEQFHAAEESRSYTRELTATRKVVSNMSSTKHSTLRSTRRSTPSAEKQLMLCHDQISAVEGVLDSYNAKIAVANANAEKMQQQITSLQEQLKLVRKRELQARKDMAEKAAVVSTLGSPPMEQQSSDAIGPVSPLEIPLSPGVKSSDADFLWKQVEALQQSNTQKDIALEGYESTIRLLQDMLGQREGKAVAPAPTPPSDTRLKSLMAQFENYREYSKRVMALKDSYHKGEMEEMAKALQQAEEAQNSAAKARGAVQEALDAATKELKEAKAEIAFLSGQLKTAPISEENPLQAPVVDARLKEMAAHLEDTLLEVDRLKGEEMKFLERQHEVEEQAAYIKRLEDLSEKAYVSLADAEEAERAATAEVARLKELLVLAQQAEEASSALNVAKNMVRSGSVLSESQIDDIGSVPVRATPAPSLHSILQKRRSSVRLLQSFQRAKSHFESWKRRSSFAGPSALTARRERARKTTFATDVTDTFAVRMEESVEDQPSPDGVLSIGGYESEESERGDERTATEKVLEESTHSRGVTAASLQGMDLEAKELEDIAALEELLANHPAPRSHAERTQMMLKRIELRSRLLARERRNILGKVLCLIDGNPTTRPGSKHICPPPVQYRPLDDDTIVSYLVKRTTSSPPPDTGDRPAERILSDEAPYNYLYRVYSGLPDAIPAPIMYHTRPLPRATVRTAATQTDGSSRPHTPRTPRTPSPPPCPPPKEQGSRAVSPPSAAPEPTARPRTTSPGLHQFIPFLRTPGRPERPATAPGVRGKEEDGDEPVQRRIFPERQLRTLGKAPCPPPASARGARHAGSKKRFRLHAAATKADAELLADNSPATYLMTRVPPKLKKVNNPYASPPVKKEKEASSKYTSTPRSPSSASDLQWLLPMSTLTYPPPPDLLLDTASASYDESIPLRAMLPLDTLSMLLDTPTENTIPTG
eukprot:Sspe_Gene.37394::Locus_18051_Transcript_1_1_Confidence_1.000_Length_3721::g.37394::m.37394